MSRFTESVDHLRKNVKERQQRERFYEHFVAITHPNTRRARENSFVSWFVGSDGQFLSNGIPRTDALFAVALKPVSTEYGFFTVRHAPNRYNTSEYLSQLISVKVTEDVKAINDSEEVLASADMHENLWVPGNLHAPVSEIDLRSLVVVTNALLKRHGMPLFQSQGVAL